MNQIYCQTERSLVRIFILFAYIAVSYILYIGIDTQSTAREVVNRMVAEDRLLVIAWTMSIPILTYIFDLVIPKQKVVWCRISESKLEFYPEGPFVLRKSFTREEIDEIREVKEFFPGYLSVYVFLKSGRYHYFRGYRRSEVSLLLDQLADAVPNIAVIKADTDR
jgi:hypothetical protein